MDIEIKFFQSPQSILPVNGNLSVLNASPNKIILSNINSVPWHLDYSAINPQTGLYEKVYDAPLTSIAVMGNFTFSTTQEISGTISAIEYFQGNTASTTYAKVGIYGANVDVHKININAGVGAFADLIALSNPERVIVNGSTDNDIINLAGIGSEFVGYRGNEGNDTITGTGKFNIAIYSGASSEYNIVNTNGSVVVDDKIALRDGTDFLININRFNFTNEDIAYDINGNAGQAYRLYQAAFDRKPDAGGLGYWIAQLDKGSSLHMVADFFLGSTEFQALYGISPTNAAFVDALYKNVLHRAGEQGGVDYWNGILNSGGNRADVLANFSESAENKAGVIGSIQNGIHYTEYVG